MSLAKYDKYKDSGVDWLGEIPEHWEDRRIKDIFLKIGSGTTPNTSRDDYYENGTIYWLNTTDLNNDLVFDTKQKITQIALKESGLKIYPINSLAIAMYGQGKTRGTVGLLQIPTTTNQAACIMFSPKGVNTKYILYWFIHKYDAIRSINIGATQPNMNQDFVKFLALQCPPLSEQSAIATYLDSKTSAIDRKVDLLEQKITRYQQLRKSLINETVCRGLDKNVKLKDSGIEFIGMIPEHWEVKRGKEILNIKYGYPLDSDAFSNNENDGFPIIRIRDLNNQVVQTFYQKGIVKEALVSNGALLTGMDGDFQTVIWEGGAALLNQRICELKGTKKMNTRFLYYSFPLAIKVINEMKFYTTVKHLSDADLKIVNVFCPPISEQTTIANYLDEKTQKIDGIVSNIKAQIETLKELRKTLINDVVTGKIKVSS